MIIGISDAVVVSSFTDPCEESSTDSEEG